eukprot:1599665-Rhodomonas_salina.3
MAKDGTTWLYVREMTRVGVKQRWEARRQSSSKKTRARNLVPGCRDRGVTSAGSGLRIDKSGREADG